MNAHLAIAAATVALASSFGALRAQTTVSIVADRDNTLYESPTGSTSNGQGYLFCGLTAGGEIRRTLLHFDVANSVPSGAVIVSAELHLEVLQSTAFPPIATSIHRVTQDWGEGPSLAPGNGGGGTAAAAGDATWQHTFFPTSFWTNAGGDFDTATTTFAMASLGSTTTGPSAALAADAQQWLDNPGGNFGWLLKTDELLASTARRIASSQTATNKPTLVVHYITPGNNSIWGVGCPVGTSTATTMFSGAATGGATISINRFDTVQNSIGVDFFSLFLDPAGVPLQPGCTVYLSLLQEIIPGGVFLSGAGTSTDPFTVPAGFPGYLIACQSAVLDNSPVGLSLSNAALLVTQ